MMGIRFLQFAGRRVAYAVTGSGSPLVAPAWWISHLELDWNDDAFRSFWESVGAGHTLVRYDRPGVGMSDREVRGEDLTLDGEVALVRAVLDWAEFPTVRQRRTMRATPFLRGSATASSAPAGPVSATPTPPKYIVRSVSTLICSSVRPAR